MPNPCACCQTTTRMTRVYQVALCPACAALHQIVLPTDAPSIAIKRDLETLHRLLAQIDERRRLERGEDGFDG